ncbi:hypothetical protein KAS42_01410, partial [bacterium]|nr:hypothetical protein [bacterium]
EDIFKGFDFGNVKDVFDGFGRSSGVRGFDDLFSNISGPGGRTRTRVTVINDGSGQTFKAINLDDIFDSLFHTGRQTISRQDVYLNISFTAEELIKGTGKKITKRDGKVLHVKIPPRTKEGTKLRLQGQGKNGADLYLVVKRK